MLILLCRPSPRDLPPDRRQLPKTSPGQSLLAPPWLTYFTSSRNNRKDQVSQTPEDHQMEKHPPSQHLPSLSSENEALELTLICWSSLTLRSRVWTLTQELRGTSLPSFWRPPSLSPSSAHIAWSRPRPFLNLNPAWSHPSPRMLSFNYLLNLLWRKLPIWAMKHLQCPQHLCLYQKTRTLKINFEQHQIIN